MSGGGAVIRLRRQVRGVARRSKTIRLPDKLATWYANRARALGWTEGAFMAHALEEYRRRVRGPGVPEAE